MSARSSFRERAGATPSARPAAGKVRRVVRGGLVGVLAATAVAAGLVGGGRTSTDLGDLQLTAGCPSAGGARVPEVALPGSGDFAFLGHGWGHGMGMSQYGAQGAARLGCSYSTILGTYYQGSRLVNRPLDAPVLLSLLSSSSRSTLQTIKGGATWVYGSARVAQPQGQTWQVRRVARDSHGPAGAVLLDAAGHQRLRVPTGATLVAAHTGHTVRVRSFVGSRSSASSDLTTRYDQARFAIGTSSTTVTEAIVASGGVAGAEKYLWGLAEIPASWPTEALKAQAVAARSYLATKYDSKLRAYKLSTTTMDQVYGGDKRESADARLGSPWHRAVDATRGKLLVTSAGTVVTTMYSSSMGGFTEDRSYVYGGSGLSYLKAVDDSRWDLASDNPAKYRSWGVGVSKATIAAKFGLSSVTSVSIPARGSAQRLGGVVITGVKQGHAVTLHVSGATMRYRLGLLSPGFTVRAIPHPTTPPSTPSTPSPSPSAAVALATGGQALVGDFDGDGRDDVGWYKAGRVGIRTDTGRVLRWSLTQVPYGAVLVGDFNGDGRDGLAVYSRGVWYFREALSTGGPERTVRYGAVTDKPVVGHWYGPGRQDGIGVVRGGHWLLRTTATAGPAQRVMTWGSRTAAVLTGDWNGNGLTQPGTRVGTAWALGKDIVGASAPGLALRRTAGSLRDSGRVGSWHGARADSVVLVQGCRFSFVSTSLGATLGRIDFCG